ncbi:MAG: TIGR04282 family arsenosugar biosynthesis glycosyltransferase [Acidobacteriaceae bacterium]
MASPDILIVVAKKPIAGQTKTRLCPPLSHQQAADLYVCFLQDTLDLMRSVGGVQCLIGYLPENAGDYFRYLAPDMEQTPQMGSSLGERLDHLLSTALMNGACKAVVMDSDSPTLPHDYLVQAFAELEKADVVLGPTKDGGYYLIGLKHPQPHLLREVQMSTPHVLEDTLVLAKETSLIVALLPTWYDIDTLADLKRLAGELASPDGNGPAPSTREWLKRSGWTQSTS